MIEVEGEARLGGLEVIRRGVNRGDRAAVAPAHLDAAVELAAGRVGEQHGRAAALGRRQPVDDAAIFAMHRERHRDAPAPEVLEHLDLVGDLARRPPTPAIDPQHIAPARGLDEIAVVEPAMQQPAGRDAAKLVVGRKPGRERIGRERGIGDGERGWHGQAQILVSSMLCVLRLARYAVGSG
jgi:hypothetical protein